MQSRPDGALKWLNWQKGDGFIGQDEGKELFVRCRSVQADGFKPLIEDQRVRFDSKETEKRPVADNVYVIQP
jgi:CspA family cold shock protein